MNEFITYISGMLFVFERLTSKSEVLVSIRFTKHKNSLSQKLLFEDGQKVLEFTTILLGFLIIPTLNPTQLNQ